MATKKAEHKAKNHQNGAAIATAAENPKKNDLTEILQRLELLSGVLESELSSVDLDTALDNIDDWQKLLKEAKAPKSQEIASDLKELHKLLKKDNVVVQELGELLSRLGEEISELAANSDKELKILLQILGQQLAKAGKSLVKAENTQMLEALDELTEILDQDVDELDSESGTQEIDYWHSLLQKSEDSDIKEIATKLKELRKLLGGNKTKAQDISQKLIQLGEHTTDVADSAIRGFKGVIKTLGKSLVKLGESIE